MIRTDPRPLRPVDRNDMNIRAKYLLAPLHFPRPENEQGSHLESIGDEMITDDIFPNMSLAVTQTQVDYANQLPLPRNDSSSSLDSVCSTDSIRSMRTRIFVSSGFAKTVISILRYSDQRPPEHCFAEPEPYMSQSQSQGGLSPDTGLATPGDFIVALAYERIESRRIIPTKGLADSWPKIADKISKPNLQALYLDADEELCQRAQGLLSSALRNEYVSDERDLFGNTLLHVLAARKWTPRGAAELFHVIMNVHARDLSSTNTAQQTFMHVLDSTWCTGLNNPSAPLPRILRTLMARNATSILRIRDVYGNTFFHNIWGQILDNGTYDKLFELIDSGELGRNAFGVIPRRHTVIPEQQTSQQGMPQSSSECALQEDPEEQVSLDILRLGIVTEAYTNPHVEGDQGRNGLQCLVELYPTFFMNEAPPSSSERSPSRRAEGTYGMTLLRQYMQGLLTPIQDASLPDVNHYDDQGETPLMSIVRRVPDRSKDSEEIRWIISLLVEKGAMIEARNSHGETALLIAAQTGRRTAFIRLLELGANVHARDSYGWGVAIHIAAAVEEAKDDLAVYGPCEALRAVTAKALWRERGAKFQPTLVDEWSLLS